MTYFTFMAKTIISAALILLSGCAATEIVYVPVSSCPQPPTITMPELAVSRLPQKPATAEGLKALLEDHITLKSTIEQCITSLEGYRTP